MSVISWAVVGIAVGMLAGLVANGRDILQNTILAMVGATIAGWLYLVATGGDVTGSSLPDGLVALAGAVLFVVLARSLTRGRTAI